MIVPSHVRRSTRRRQYAFTPGTPKEGATTMSNQPDFSHGGEFVTWPDEADSMNTSHR